MTTRIVQFGLPHSPNLGDGVISDCLAFAVREHLPGARFTALDLSGRRGRGDVTVARRSLALTVLGAMPRPLRERVVVARVERLLARVAPLWDEALRGADLAILGGGQIFSDADLNFPVKVARACAAARRHGVPMAVHAAGVARNWSRRGAELFAAVLDADLRAIGLRDAHSLAAWRDQVLGASPAPVIARDPGLLAAECYGAGADGGGERMGVCVTAPGILAYHADDRAARRDGLGVLARVATGLAERGRAVTLFTNGAAEDRAALARLSARPEVAALVAEGRVAVAPAAETPAELARQVGGLAGVVAHRLHACILGYAYGLPVVGLGWDRKVESFFESIGRRDLFLPAGAAPAAVVARAERALAEGVDLGMHARVVAEAREGVRAVLDAGLRDAGGARRAGTVG